MSTSGAVRVLTYNLHSCVGRDGVHDIARSVALVARAQPDIVGLQEVDSREGRDVWRAFERELHMYAVPGATLWGGRGRYGNLLLSRFPCTRVRHHDLAVARREPRRAIDARLRTPRGALRVVVTHLGLRAAERASQLQRLARALADDWDAGPMIVMGDFNEWRRPRRIGPGLHAGLVTAGLPRSFPSNYPLFALDQIWGYPAGLLQDVCALRGGVARLASDHLPLLATATPGRGAGERRW